MPGWPSGRAMAAIFLPEHPAIPGYEPVQLLGRNGGIVYLARRVSSGELVVLRVACEPWFADYLGTRDALLLSLDHPNILRVFEIGDVGGRAYAAEEYIKRTLADRLGDGPLPAAQAVLLTRTLALTLGYVRNHHMIQPNLTPTTILLTDKNDPKLFDLELTEVVEKWDAQKRVRAMRPAFSAPEDLAGGNIVSVRTDVYRVGATMYAMLTSQPPFACDNREIVTAVLEQIPASLRQLNAAVPRGVEAVCFKCLEKRPEHRYASLQELADALARL